MQAGNLVTSDAAEYTSRILVNGTQRQAASWSVDRELSGDLPAQVSVMSGLVQATGTIVWVPDHPVDDFPTTPLNDSSGWMPRKGDHVQIYQGDGVTEWQVFEGVVDKSNGEVGEPGFQSRIIDHRDKLSKPFRHDPLLRVMPPQYRADPNYRGVGLTYLYYVDAALRRAGFYATPPAESRQAVSVPAQSSMWPEVGGMTTGAVEGVSGGSWANTWNSVDGVSISNVLATYAPAVSQPYTEMIRLSLTVDPEHAGFTILTCRFGGSHNVQLSINSLRVARAFVNGALVTQVPLGDAIRVSMIVDGSSIELRTDMGATAAGAHSVVTSTLLDTVQCQADESSRVAGFHVTYPSASTKWDYTNFAPTAHYHFDSLYLLGLLDAAPAITEGTCYDVLREISEATISAMWIDETGTFRWAPSNVLTGIPPVRSLTTADDVLSMSWSDDLLAVRSEVTVTMRTPAISTSRWDNVLWYQGNRQSLESGQEVNEFASPDSDTDWVQPSPSYLVYGEPGSSATSNRGHGSFAGAVLTDGDTESNGADYLSSSIEKINGDTYMLTHYAGSIPSGHTLELRYVSESGSIWPRWHGEAFPLLRGFGKVEWAETEVQADSTGPDWAPPLTHDAGPWLARATHHDNVTSATRLANYLQTLTSREWPSIGDMPVIPDPRLQLGDRVTIRSEHYLGTIFSGIIVRLDRSADDTGSNMTIGLRLTTMETTFQTYEAWNTQHPGVLTYAQWEALTAQTYYEFITSED